MPPSRDDAGREGTGREGTGREGTGGGEGEVRRPRHLDDLDVGEDLLDAVPDPWGVPSVVHLRAGGTSLLLAAHGPGLPRVLHWGGDLGELSVDETDALAGAVSAVGDDADAGTPLLAAGVLPGLGLSCPEAPSAPVPVLRRARATLSVTATGHQRLRVRAVDAVLRAAVDVAAEVDPTGVLRLRAAATLGPASTCRLTGLHLVLPVPAAGRQVLVDVGGRLRPEASRRGLRVAEGAGPVRPSEVVGAAVVHTAGSTPEEVWAIAATTVSRRSEARRGADPLVRVLRVPGGGLVLSGGEDVPAGGGETTWTTPLLVAAHGRSWADVRTRLSAAGRAAGG